MNKRKILFIDRDGTLIQEPLDEQIDHMNKLQLMSGVISALLTLKKSGYVFVLVSNQDNLGTDKYPYENFLLPHNMMLNIFSSQGIDFEAIRICPHASFDHCDCRKPKIGLVLDYLVGQNMDMSRSFVIGDRITDMRLAENMGIQGLRIGHEDIPNWEAVVNKILTNKRMSKICRTTNETKISLLINLDNPDVIQINTGIRFFDHMLEQFAKHAGFSLSIEAKGDDDIDDHHTIEDTAIALGEAFRMALGDKWGINRYGFVLPMDDALTQVAIDFSGRFYLKFSGDFNRERIGDFSLEMIPHFFRSFAQALKATLHIEVKGENAHHMAESVFKGVGRALRQAMAITDTSLPSTKGVL